MHEVQKSDSKRIIIDSVSSILSAGINKNQFREFLLQLTGYFKLKGITCIITYLNDGIFGGTEGQMFGGGATSELRLSSIVDGIILLKYLESEKSIIKIMNVLKLRGSGHDRSIRKYEITKEGIKIELGKRDLLNKGKAVSKTLEDGKQTKKVRANSGKKSNTFHNKKRAKTKIIRKKKG